jgi:hypothetical protein
MPEWLLVAHSGRLTENAIRTTFRLGGTIAVDTHNSKFVRGFAAKCRFKRTLRRVF